MENNKNKIPPPKVGTEIGWMLGSHFDCYNHWLAPTFFRGVVELVRGDSMIVSGREIAPQDWGTPDCITSSEGICSETKMLACPLTSRWIRFS